MNVVLSFKMGKSVNASSVTELSHKKHVQVHPEMLPLKTLRFYVTVSDCSFFCRQHRLLLKLFMVEKWVWHWFMVQLMEGDISNIRRVAGLNIFVRPAALLWGDVDQGFIWVWIWTQSLGVTKASTWKTNVETVFKMFVARVGVSSLNIHIKMCCSTWACSCVSWSASVHDGCSVQPRLAVWWFQPAHTVCSYTEPQVNYLLG